jgi:hypothetical protein
MIDISRAYYALRPDKMALPVSNDPLLCTIAVSKIIEPIDQNKTAFLFEMSYCLLAPANCSLL